MASSGSIISHPALKRGGIRTYLEILDEVIGILKREVPDSFNGGLKSIEEKEQAIFKMPDIGHKQSWLLTAWGSKRPSWFLPVRRYFYQNPVGFLTTNRVPYYQCGLCNLVCTIQGIQLDHIVPWKSHIHEYISHEGISNLQAKIIYNDPRNLRALCSFCNQSHPEMKSLAQSTRGHKIRTGDDAIKLLSECTEDDPDQYGDGIEAK